MTEQEKSGTIFSDEELDAIRALLDEDGPVTEQAPAEVWNEPKPTAVWEAPQVQQTRARNPASSRAEAFEKQFNRELNPPVEEKKDSKGLVIFLSILIVLELAAIALVGTSWYLWMK